MSHLDGTGLAAVVVLTVAAVVVIVIVSRVVARDREIRVSRVGWFVERERFEDAPRQAEPPDEETHVDWPKRPDDGLP